MFLEGQREFIVIANIALIVIGHFLVLFSGLPSSEHICIDACTYAYICILLTRRFLIWYLSSLSQLLQCKILYHCYIPVEILLF